MRTTLSADWALALDDAGPVLVENSAIVVEGDRIVDVTTRGHAGTPDRTVELGEALVLPGLIDLDALTDIDHLILDAWGDAAHARRLRWSADYATHSRHVFTAAQRRRIREIGLVQLALHGIASYMPIASEVHTEWAEESADFLAMADFSSRLGLRGFLGPSYRAGVNVVDAAGHASIHLDEDRGRAGLADAIRFVDEITARHDPLLTGVFLPCRIETQTPEILAGTARAASERGALVRLHALQGLAEREWSQHEYGRTPLDLIAAQGLLNDRLIIPHGVFLDVNPRVDGADHGDLARLVDAGVSIVHCALTNARYGSELYDLDHYLRAGLTVALGTDSFPPDLIRGIDAGVSAAKVQHHDLSYGDVAAYMRAATLGGAAALHRPDLGRIAPGAAADLSAFSLRDVRMGAVEDPVRTLMLNGTARDATLTMVAGRVVMHDGEIDGVNLERVRADTKELFAVMRAAYPERDHRRGDPGAEPLFPPVFPHR